MNKIIVSAALLVSTGWIWAGCRGPYDPITPRSRDFPLEQHQQTHGVSMLSKSARDALILVQAPEAKRAPGGQIQIRTLMESRYSTGDLWADVQYVFFDENQFPVEKSEWLPVHFPARELVPLEGSSLRNDATSFNVQFKNLRTPNGRKPRASGWVFEWGIYFENILPK